MSKVRLPKALLGRVIWRSFFLQASWNFERLQSLGMLFAIAPALRAIHQGEELANACRRHLEYFNTHPFMASPVMGTILFLEEGSSDPDYVELKEFRRMVMAPYAAMGDALFWGGLRPIAAGVSLFFAARGSLWAPFVFLAIFNIPHIWMRISGLFRGYVQGLKVVEVIQRRRLPDLAIRLKEGMIVLLGGLCAYLTFLTLREEDFATGLGLLVIPVVVMGGRLICKGLSTLLLVLTASALILGLLWIL
jgi:mannose PTS system EIID component